MEFIAVLGFVGVVGTEGMLAMRTRSVGRRDGAGWRCVVGSGTAETGAAEVGDVETDPEAEAEAELPVVGEDEIVNGGLVACGRRG